MPKKEEKINPPILLPARNISAKKKSSAGFYNVLQRKKSIYPFPDSP
jgi:hypothetical protein